jgi:16S rRNA (guanine(966)-N(2))-methyltransferase RsmD
MPRIITGTAKGIELKVPHKARPISDRAKSSIFSVIGPDIVDKRILDLYAGSGSLGLEALSRGASWCTFVEASKFGVKDIKDNIEKCGFEEIAHATRQKVLPFLNNLTEEYDIVFADPPYNFYKERTDRAGMLIEKIERVIPEGGAIVLKHPSSLELPEFETLTLADQRKFGTNTVSLWVKVHSRQ